MVLGCSKQRKVTWCGWHTHNITTPPSIHQNPKYVVFDKIPQLPTYSEVTFSYIEPRVSSIAK